MNRETLGEAPADALAVDDAEDSIVESGISSGKGGGEKTRSMSEGVEAATAISSQVKGEYMYSTAVTEAMLRSDRCAL